MGGWEAVAVFFLIVSVITGLIVAYLRNDTVRELVLRAPWVTIFSLIVLIGEIISITFIDEEFSWSRVLSIFIWATIASTSFVRHREKMRLRDQSHDHRGSLTSDVPLALSEVDSSFYSDDPQSHEEPSTGHVNTAENVTDDKTFSDER